MLTERSIDYVSLHEENPVWDFFSNSAIGASSECGSSGSGPWVEVGWVSARETPDICFREARFGYRIFCSFSADAELVVFGFQRAADCRNSDCCSVDGITVLLVGILKIRYTSINREVAGGSHQ